MGTFKTPSNFGLANLQILNPSPGQASAHRRRREPTVPGPGDLGGMPGKPSVVGASVN